MKKIFAISCLLALVSAGVVFAAGVTATNPNGAWAIGDGSGNATINATGVGAGVTCSIKLSANVAAYYVGTATNYIINTAHASGTKSFSSAGSDNRIYMKENATKNAYISETSGNTEPAKVITIAANNTVDFAGWTAVK